MIDLIQMNDLSPKIAFLINIYYLMVRVAQIDLGIPKSYFTRAYYFTTIHINIGGDLYSFNDWMHEIWTTGFTLLCIMERRSVLL